MLFTKKENVLLKKKLKFFKKWFWKNIKKRYKTEKIIRLRRRVWFKIIQMHISIMLNLTMTLVLIILMNFDSI